MGGAAAALSTRRILCPHALSPAAAWRYRNNVCPGDFARQTAQREEEDGMAASNSGGGRRMKIGLSLSLSERSLNGQTPTYRDVQAMAQEAERIGCDSVWLADHLPSRLSGQDEACQL